MWKNFNFFNQFGVETIPKANEIVATSRNIVLFIDVEAGDVFFMTTLKFFYSYCL